MKKFLLLIFMLSTLTSFSQSFKRSPRYYSSDDNTRTGLTFTIAGIAFTGAALLERNVYWTYSSPMNIYNAPIVRPPFWKQTPRNAMFVIGIGFTMTGLFTMLSNR